MLEVDVQTIRIQGMTVTIPAYYQQVESAQGDPPNSIPLMVETPNALCLLFIYPISPDMRVPTDKERLLEGVRMYLTESQGMIEVGQGHDYVYSIVKTLRENHGVQYILTFQKLFSAKDTLTVRGYFEEIGTTGLRDSVVYDYCRRGNIVGSDDDPFANWTRDPYDPQITDGALMNRSELPEFDKKFPGFPLSMCREIVRALTKDSE